MLLKAKPDFLMSPTCVIFMLTKPTILYCPALGTLILQGFDSKIMDGTSEGFASRVLDIRNTGSYYKTAVQI
jgi:hypothetical protein